MTSANAFSWNKSLLTNSACLLLVMGGYLLPEWQDILLSMGFFGLSGSITNWLAIHMLFEKVPGLYGSGIIPNKFEEFKDGIEQLIMNQFFTKDNLDRFLTNHFSDPSTHRAHIDLQPLLDKLDYDVLFDQLLAAVRESPMGAMLQMFGGEQALEPLKEPFQDKLKAVLEDIVQRDDIQSALREIVIQQLDSPDFLQKIDGLVRQRLDELTPEMVKDIIQNMIREHLGWLVVWGGFFGAILGLFASFVS
jgi:uncharacterized membrane protein YheB (UPF0754 family)